MSNLTSNNDLMKAFALKVLINNLKKIRIGVDVQLYFKNAKVFVFNNAFK
jgi:hypothetical protein